MSVASQTNVNCFGASTGTANVSTIGGTGPYTYTWSPGSLTGASQTGLSAGTYTIAIKDANSCVGTGTVIITQPTASLSAVISATTPAGCGSSTGGATVTASGGTAGYTYSWVPSGGTTAGVSNLATGNNTVTVTDSKGCTRTAVATISSASGPTLSVVSQASVNCFGASTGSASVNPTGGTGPYTYTWTPGNLSGISQTGLAAGTYTVNVADVSGCSGTTTLTIAQPASALSAVISATTPASCGGSTTTAIFWTENFGVGCNQGALASVYTGTNGAWAVTNTGVNNPSASQWFVSATESGMGAGNCGDGCLGTGTTNKTLHVANVSTSPAAFIFCPTGDCGSGL
ncbi:MAG: SprB repeat-containing protein [Bacteroidetes bacterium]|nr:SprB repeat-containing protein [Bacteroidota bacterium]